MRSLLTAVGLVALVLVVPAVAEAREWELSAGLTGHRARSSSMDAVAENDAVPLGDFALAVRVLDFVPILGALSVELRYQVGGVEAVDFTSFRGGLTLDSARAGVVAMRPVLHRRLRAFVRADAGFLTGLVELTATGTNGEEERLGDRAWATCAYGGLGAELALFQAAADAPNPELALGLRLEAGYMAAGDLSFAAKPIYPDDGVDRIDTVPAPLGAIDASGYSIGMHFFGRW